MAKKTERAVALFFALLFFATSAGVAVLVVYQIQQDNKNAKTRSEIQEAFNKTPEQLLAEQKAKEQTETNKPTEGTLEGTKLTDFQPVESVTELQKIDVVEGTGEEVKPGDTVTAHYTGALAKDGTIFQSSHDSGSPVPFSLTGVIQGWQDGVPGMKVGGKRRLLIPAAQAYAAQEKPGIPANSDLVFDIELVKIGQ